jgi:hypothetical protein
LSDGALPKELEELPRVLLRNLLILLSRMSLICLMKMNLKDLGMALVLLSLNFQKEVFFFPVGSSKLI